MPASQNLSPQRGDRRRFLTQVGAGAIGLAGASLLAEPAHAAPPVGVTDAAVLNFALNLEYLEAEYYSYALTGQSITAQGVAVSGAGTPGGVTIKANPVVPFANADLQSFAAEIAADEISHVKFLRNTLATLGVQPIARPQIDLLNSFNALAQAAGLPGFDPFVSEANFFVGVFIFEDVGVTAYKGGSRLLSNKDVLENAAGILAVEAYHASTGRRVLYDNRNNQVTGAPAGVTYGAVAQAISALRARLSNAADDQPVTGDPLTGGANLVPTDANAIAFSRTTRQVLNVVYGDATGAAHSGGFFPAGANGAIK